jgi:hypothetical protein
MLAPNQKLIASELSKVGAVVVLNVINLVEELTSMPVLRGDPFILSLMSHAARKICSRDGVTYTVNMLMRKSNEYYFSLQ